MVEKKLLGNKTKAGFYKKGAKKGEFETFDPYKLEYRPKAGDDGLPEVPAVHGGSHG